MNSVEINMSTNYMFACVNCVLTHVNPIPARVNEINIFVCNAK
jgi:hypothetical protein